MSTLPPRAWSDYLNKANATALRKQRILRKVQFDKQAAKQCAVRRSSHPPESGPLHYNNLEKAAKAAATAWKNLYGRWPSSIEKQSFRWACKRCWATNEFYPEELSIDKHTFPLYLTCEDCECTDSVERRELSVEHDKKVSIWMIVLPIILIGTVSVVLLLYFWPR